MPTEPILDADTIDALRSYETDGLITLKELFETFQDDMTLRAKAITEALQQSNLAKLEQSAHALKSAAGNVGAFKIRDICQQLEDLGRSDTVAGTAELFEVLTTEIPKVEQALKNLISP